MNKNNTKPFKTVRKRTKRKLNNNFDLDRLLRRTIPSISNEVLKVTQKSKPKNTKVKSKKTNEKAQRVKVIESEKELFKIDNKKESQKKTVAIPNDNTIGLFKFNTTQIEEFLYSQNALSESNKKLSKQERKQQIEKCIEIAKSRFSEAQMSEFKELFTELDKNGDKLISIDEMTFIIKTIGLKIDKKIVANIMRNFDVDCNNSLNLDEFVCLMSKLFDSQSEDIELREAFDLFDLDSDSFITYNDLKEFFKINKFDKSFNVDEKLIRDMITYADINKDEKIDFHEFSSMYKVTVKVLEQLNFINNVRTKQNVKLHKLLDKYLV